MRDFENAKKIAEEKYGVGKYYDPIKNEFFKENEEKIQWDTVNDTNKRKKEAKISTLPPTYMLSEG